jgi:hypothetical protein
MKIKTRVCATAVALLIGTACFAAQAEGRGPATPVNQLRVWTSHSNKKPYMNAAAVYDAGVQRGRARSSRDAYLRGFRDGTSTAAYTSRQSITNSVPVYSGAAVYSAAPAYGYSSYSRYTAYTPAVAGSTVALGNSYGDNDGHAYNNDYGDGYGYSHYNASYVPRGVKDVAVTPVVTARPLEAQIARLSYCTAGYQSFDPASGTFLADDGYRHYCR